MSKWIRALAALVAAALLFCGQALPVRAAAPQEYFTISNYDIKINITEDDVYDITESITVNFTEPRHGIYRTIPVEGTLKRDSAQYGPSQSDYRVKITDVDVQGYEYETTTGDGKFTIKIGSANETVSGKQTYVIHYKMHWRDDGMRDFDEVYYNLVGLEWDTQIDAVNFSVTLPKEFDPGTVGFAAGKSGEQQNAAVFSVQGNTITGSTTRPLGNYEGLTMRVELPQGYFVFPDSSGIDGALMAAMLALAVLGVVLWFLFGREGHLVKTVEFYAPEGLTPAEVGYIIDGYVDNKDVVALILHWAHKGYLGIEEPEKNRFRFIKLKDASPSMVNFEQFMFNKLFDGRTVVEMDDLKYTFYKTIDTTKTMVSNSFAGAARRVFTGRSLGLQALMSILTALPVFGTLIYALQQTGDSTDMLITSVIISALVLLPVYFLIGTMRAWRGEKRALRMVKLIVFLFLCFLAMCVFLIATYDKVTLPALPWVAALSTVLLGLCAVFMNKRTPKGLEWLGKLLGFKDFIELAERDKLEQLVAQDPSYFFNVLPYAYVLGVTDKWARNFEQLTLQPPSWYYGAYPGDRFSTVLFTHSLMNSMSHMQSSMTAKPSSGGSGGGGFSGGGFSGGGGGGGGGGSW